MSDTLWFYRDTISYEQLLKHLKQPEYEDEKCNWVFRGQTTDYELMTSLERYCYKADIELAEAGHIEETIVREFKRLYNKEDREDVIKDTLYCMSLLRHYGSPTRLLDFSYSKYIGLYFGLKAAHDKINITDRSNKNTSFALWCIDAKDMNHRAKDLYSDDSEFLIAFTDRYSIDKRNDATFGKLYLGDKYEMVVSENPARIHDRLHLQQGVLMCQGKLNKPFMDNLHYVYKSGNTEKVKRLICELTISDLKKAFDELMKMNINEESLFPGLDGHARAVGYKLWFYKQLYARVHEEGGS